MRTRHGRSRIEIEQEFVSFQNLRGRILLGNGKPFLLRRVSLVRLPIRGALVGLRNGSTGHDLHGHQDLFRGGDRGVRGTPSEME